MRMLSGEKLGEAITAAMEKKKVGPTEVAEHFGIKPPSVKDWQKRGCVHKKHLGRLVSYFADVVPPEHWGAEVYEISAITAHQVSESAMSPYQAIPGRAFVGVSNHNAFPMAPVLDWARMGVDLYRANDEWPASELRAVPTSRAVSDRIKWVPVVDDALAPKIQPGDLVAIDPQGSPARDEVALFKTSDGGFLLRRWRPLASGAFEAVDASGHALDSDRHGLTCVGSFVGLFKDKV